MQSEIVEEYMRLIGQQKLWPPLNGYSPFIQGSEWNIRKYFGKYFSDKLKYHWALVINKNESIMFVSEDGIHLMSKEFLQSYLLDQDLLKIRSNYFYSSIAKIDKLYAEVDYKFVAKKTLEELLAICEDVRFLIWDPNAAIYASVFLEEEFCWEIIEKSEFKITREDFDAVWDEAIHPVEGSFDKQQLMHILNLFVEEKSWPEIVEECQYFYTSYRDAKSLVEVEKRLKEQFGHLNNKELALKEIESEEINEKERKEKYAKWYGNLNKNQKIIADYLQAIIIIRDRRKNFFNKGATIWWRVAQKMFQAAGISEKYIIYYTFREMKMGLEYLKKNKESIVSREDGFIEIISYEGEVEMKNLTPAEFLNAKEILTEFYLKDHRANDVYEIHGNIGAPGKISGKVRVIIDINKGNDFKDGEILVTGMTRPEFVPLMKKASAIITDEGGITCHAAIVARELKKPCIIGTKIATQVLKDGDSVEVDADNGIVRILRKA